MATLVGRRDLPRAVFNLHAFFLRLSLPGAGRDFLPIQGSTAPTTSTHMP